MLHQLIFAAPKPGMSERDFQDYWVHKHAVQFASKIPQIRRYCVDTRIAQADDAAPPLFGGVAEIWLDDADALLAALQSPELIQGARADEPNWAAFWQTIALNTETHEILAGPPPGEAGPRVKSITLVKRKPGTTLADFRRYSLDVHAPKVLKVPGLRRYHQCHIPDMFYAVGETPFDGAGMMWFDDVAAARAAFAADAYTRDLSEDLEHFTDRRYVYKMLVEENWIIGPNGAGGA